MSDPFVDIPITGFDPAFLPTSVLEAELVASAASAQRALTHRRLQVLVVFNGRAVWIARGFASCAAWWAVIAHIKLSTARDHIRVARALHKFESLDRALAEQTLSYAKIRCLVPHAHANNVADLATLARHTPTGRLSATLAAYRNAQLTCAQMGSTDTTLAAPLATLPPLTYSCAQPIVNYMTRAVTTTTEPANSAVRVILDKALDSLNQDELNELREMLDHETQRGDIEFFQDTWGLNQSEAAELFGVSRQAYSKWLAGGPPTSKAMVFADLAASSELLVRYLQRSRIPAVVRRPAAALGGSSLVDLVAAGRSSEVLVACRAMFAFENVQ